MWNRTILCCIYGFLLQPVFVKAAVSVDESESPASMPVAPRAGQVRTVDPSTAENPRIERRPLGTAIGGATSATPITRQGDQPLSMKCWQEGKLIIDQPVKAPPSDTQKGATMTNAMTGSTVYAFDFKNAMCVIK